MRDLFLLAMFALFAVLGFGAPFVFMLGYVWVDFFRPQDIAFSFVRNIPLAEFLAIATILGFVYGPKTETSRLTFNTCLMLLWALWCTLTLIWAVSPDAAWAKWDWAFKTICFAAFIPFVISTRTRIESLLLVIGLSVLGHTLASATKVILSGGGYRLNLGLIEGNSLLGEGATLATIALSSVPILLYFRKHSRFLPPGFVTNGVYFTAIAAAVIAAIGSQERTALVALVVLAALLWWTSKHKLLATATISLAVVSLAYFVVSADWTARMQTITDYQNEGSALVRLGVWKWTLAFVAEHPLGGGFGTFLTDSFILGSGNQRVLYRGVAAHSVYFEVLGEQGIVGAAIYGTLLLSFFHTIRRTRKATTKLGPEMQWAAELSRAMQVAMLVYVVGGAFVGIAYQPYVYYLLAAATALRQQVAPVTRRVPLYRPIPEPSPSPQALKAG